MKKTSARFLYIVIASFLLASPASASVTLSTAVFDHKAKARDILQETVTVVNPTSRYFTVYPVVQNVLSATGRTEFVDPSRADLSDSLANWIFFPRGGIELGPGERRTIPFEIRVNLTAKPGIYHAAIAFPEGPNRDTAEANLASAPAFTVNLEVAEEVVENIQLKKFVPERKIFLTYPALFRFELENFGNRPEVPAGDILIYDKTGREVASIEANPGATGIEPGAKREFTASWRAPDFGQYKAVLSVRYGGKSAAQVQDTIFFWNVPWQKAVLVALGLSLGLMSIAFYISKRLHRAQFAGHPGLSSAGIPHVVDLRHPPRHD